jgi:hypothetical protein
MKVDTINEVLLKFRLYGPVLLGVFVEGLVGISSDDERQAPSRQLQSNVDLAKRKRLWTDAA